MAGAIVLSAFLQVVFEKTASLLIQQFKGIWGVDVHKQLTKLKKTLETVQAVLEDAEEQQLKSRAIRLWLSRLKDAAYEADDILDEFQWEVLRKEAGIQSNMMNMMVRRFFSSENPLLFRITMGRRIREIAERFDVIAAQKSNFHLNPMNYSGESSSTARTETHSFVVEHKVVGRRDDIAKIVEMLIGQENSTARTETHSIAVLPIVGMGGLGKTTVAQMVYNEPRVRQHFQLHMWICVSEDFDVTKVAKAILEEAAKGNQSGASPSMESLQKSLREVLSSKRYLLVLDDVWNEVVTKWEQLKVLLSFGARGSVVVTTTRSEVVGSIMGTIGPYKLSNLSEDECWDLFRQRAFAGGREEDSELVEIGKRIVNKFGGLPLAAKTVGSLMKFKKEKTQWLPVLNSELWDMPAGENEILPALKLSYNHLPSYLKQCFAFCAVFPKDHILQDGMLIQLWMANGLIPSQGNMELEDKGHEIFNDLASRSFFQDSREIGFDVTEHNWYSKIDCNTTKTCKMHDLIHDLATNVMGNECCILESTKHLGTSRNFESLLHLTINDRYAIEKTIADTIRKLAGGVHTVLNLERSVPLPRQFLWNSLRVLHWKNSNSVLNIGSICKLKHLRYLDLSRCKCVALPEGIASLFHLQTLKLEECGRLRKLPKSMKSMKSLRHLYLEGSTKNFNFMPGGMGTLSSLQTLSDYVVGNASDSIGELKNLNSIGGSLSLWKLENVKDGAGAKEANLIAKEKLTSLALSWNVKEEKSEEVVEALQPHQNIRSLSMRRYGGLRFPNWLMKRPLYLPNLVKVILTDCIHCEHLPQLGQLLFLEYLELSGMNAIRCMGDNTFYGDGGSIVFPRLKELRIYGMRNLEEWQGTGEVAGGEGRAQVAFFPELIDLTLQDCPNLKVIPCIPSIRDFHAEGNHLLLLEKRFFENMKLMERLTILNCNQLSSLKDILTCDLSSLREIDIRRCENLIDSSSDGGGPQQQHQYLTSLEELRIGGSEKLACLPQYIGSLARLKHLGIFNCKKLASLEGGLGGLVELEGLTIYDCPKLITLPDELGLLPALSTLYVSYCDNLTTLPEGLGGLNRLTGLSIRECPKLTSLPNSLLQRLPNLRSLVIWDCPDLQRQFGEGGVYADIVSNIPYVDIRKRGNNNNRSSLMSNLCSICLRGGGGRST